MDVSAIRSAVRTRLETITGLTGYQNWPAQVKCPCGIVRPSSCEFDRNMDGDSILRLEIVLLMAPALSYEDGQDRLDDYLDTTGTKSIKAAVEGDIDLGSTVMTCQIPGWRDYGLVEVNATQYMGVIFDLTSWAAST